VDYIDSLLIHCARRPPTWPDDLKRMTDAFSEAKEKKLIRLKGVSCYGLPALTCATREDWMDVHLARQPAKPPRGRRRRRAALART